MSNLKNSKKKSFPLNVRIIEKYALNLTTVDEKRLFIGSHIYVSKVPSIYEGENKNIVEFANTLFKIRRIKSVTEFARESGLVGMNVTNLKNLLNKGMPKMDLINDFIESKTGKRKISRLHNINPIFIQDIFDEQGRVLETYLYVAGWDSIQNDFYASLNPKVANDLMSLKNRDLDLLLFLTKHIRFNKSCYIDKRGFFVICLLRDTVNQILDISDASYPYPKERDFIRLKTFDTMFQLNYIRGYKDFQESKNINHVASVEEMTGVTKREYNQYRKLNKPDRCILVVDLPSFGQSGK